MPSAGQLVSSQRSKPQHSADENATLHNVDINNASPKLRQPTAKEVAAAKAARIRLGYEQAGDEAGADELVRAQHGSMDVSVECRASTLLNKTQSEVMCGCRLLPNCQMALNQRAQKTSTTYL